MRRMVIAIALVMLPARAFASGFAIGKLCLDGVDEKVSTDESTRSATGVWSDVTYDSRPDAPAQLVVFRKATRPTKEFRTCTQTAQIEARDGNAPILAGTVTDLHIDARLFTATSGSNRVQIEPQKFQATLTAVTSARRPAHGGTVDLRAAPALKIVNARRIFTDSTSGSGLLELTGGSLGIAGAHIALRGGATVTATVAATSASEPQVFALDVADGQLSLVEGQLSGAASTHLKGAALDAGALSLTTPDFAVKRIVVNASRQRAMLTATGLSGQSAALTAGSVASLNYLVSAPKLTAESISGAAAFDADGMTVAAPAVAALKATADVARAAAATGGAILSGPVVLVVASANKDALDASSTWTKPSTPAAEFLFPAGTVAAARWNLSGPLTALAVSGDISATVQRLGTLTATHPLAVRLARTGVANVVRIPVKTDVNNIAGSFEVADRDQSAAVTAKLKRFHLDGFLILDLEDLSRSRAEFPIDGVAVQLETTIATTPFLAGTQPAFGAIGVTGRNRTPLTIGPSIAGLFDIGAETLTLGQPVLRVGKDGSEARASLTLNSTGSVLVTSDLRTRELLLTRGTFEAKGPNDSNGVEFRLLDPGKWIDVGGTRIVDPVLTVKRLFLRIDKTQATDVGIGTITDLRASASSISKPADPAHPTEISYSGTLAAPFTVAEFSAAHVDIKNVISIDAATLSKFSLHIRDATVNLANDAHITNGELTLDGENLQELKVNGVDVRTFQRIALAASGTIDPGREIGVNNRPSFRISVVASGQSDKLSGDGSAHLGAFSGSKQTTFDTGFACRDAPTLKVPFEFNFAIGDTDLSVHVRDGRFSGEAQTGPLALIAHTTGRAECNGNSQHVTLVAAHKAWTDWLCTKCEGLSCSMYQCRLEVEIPEVGFNWHPHAQVEFAEVSLLMSSPVVGLTDGTLHLCNIGGLQVSADLPPVMGVTPEIETPYPGATELINQSLKPGFILAESTALGGLLNGLGWTFSAATTAAGQMLCFK